MGEKLKKKLKTFWGHDSLLEKSLGARHFFSEEKKSGPPPYDTLFMNAPLLTRTAASFADENIVCHDWRNHSINLCSALLNDVFFKLFDCRK